MRLSPSEAFFFSGWDRIGLVFYRINGAFSSYMPQGNNGFWSGMGVSGKERALINLRF